MKNTSMKSPKLSIQKVLGVFLVLQVGLCFMYFTSFWRFLLPYYFACPPKNLIVGTFKSGLSVLHQNLKEYEFGMNAFKSNGAVSWTLATREEKDLHFEGRRITPWPVFHLVRHPLAVVKLIETEMLTEAENILRKDSPALEEQEKKTWIYISNFIDVPMDKPIPIRALYYWTEWNRLIKKNYPDSVIQHIEDVQWSILIKQLDIPKAKDFPPLTYHRSYFPSYQLEIPSRTWTELEELGGREIVQEAQKMSKSFFYTKSEPITVNIFQMHCEDQVYYLMDFLSTMPYSEERPLRFYYKVHQKIPDNGLPPQSISFLAATITDSRTMQKMRAPSNDLVMIAHKDEYCEFDVRTLPTTALTYRGYYDEQLNQGDVKFFPLGVRKVFPKTFSDEIVPALQRQYDCNLIVSLSTSPSRRILANIVRSSTEFNCFVHTIDAWSGSFQGYIGPEEYKEKLLQSIFTLSPRGHNIECYRIYEACETGSIPIIEDADEEDLLGGSQKSRVCKGSLEPFKRSNAPFIYISDWAKLPNLLRSLLSDRKALEKKQMELIDWYYNFKLTAITDFENDLAKAWNLD